MAEEKHLTVDMASYEESKKQAQVWPIFFNPSTFYFDELVSQIINETQLLHTV